MLSRSPSAADSAPESGQFPLVRLEQPALTLRRLSRARWSGRLSLDVERGLTHVWLQQGRIVWAESSRKHRSLGHVLGDLLSVDLQAVRALAQNWRDRRLSWVDALAESDIGIEQVRGALQEHLREALHPLTATPACRHRLEDAPAAPGQPPARLDFAPEEILCRPGAAPHERESLLQLAERVYGARSIDVVVDGKAAGFAAERDPDQRLLEAADALLLGPEDSHELVVLRSARAIWAGLRARTGERAASTWLAFDRALPLGGALMGLRAVLPLRPPVHAAPVLPSLSTAPSLFPGALHAVDYRAVLAEALALSEGALAAHVFERDAVAWASVQRRPGDALLDGLSRANSALDFCVAAGDADRNASADHAFVLLAGPHAFHVGGRLPGAGRASLFLSFAAGASYGQSVAALSVGLSALRRLPL